MTMETRTLLTLSTIAGPVRLHVSYFFLDDEALGGVEYTGTIEALLALGALSRAMLEIRAAFRRGDSRGLRDEFGRHWNLHRSPRGPGDLVVLRRFTLDVAWPGMRELFPHGFPTPVVGSQAAAAAPAVLPAAPTRPALRLAVDNTRKLLLVVDNTRPV